jgi:hypothetical protein
MQARRGGWACGYHAGCCGVQLCVPLCDDVCVPVFVRVRVLTHGPMAVLGMSSCPRRAPTCSLPGSGEMAVPGRAGVQSRVGSRPWRLSAAYSFPQCLAMRDCPEGQKEGEGRGSHHSPVTSLSVA